jgi:protein-disulfide isomerase
MTSQPVRGLLVPAGASADGTGIELGSGPVTVDAFIDFLCPFCRMFEQASGPALDRMVDAGMITLVYHPMGFLDGLSTTRYSTRAAAASGCAADAGGFREYAKVLFANQPPEGGAGLSDDVLVELGATVGLDAEFARCMRAGRYLDWVAYVSDAAIKRGVSGTPTALVNGIPVPANANTIAAAVAAFSAGTRGPKIP